MHYVSGSDRYQSEFFTRLDDMVPAHHYCRLIDLLVERFASENLSSFNDKGHSTVGRKAYHPSLLLKLYLYGYLNGISSSRKLERECHRNLEVIWLTSRLTPDHKTIADFRRANGEAIAGVVRKFNQLLKDSLPLLVLRAGFVRRPHQQMYCHLEASSSLINCSI